MNTDDLAWTPEEEEAFQALSKRRETSRNENLHVLFTVMNGTVGVGNWGSSDIATLSEHATEVRAALAPFDRTLTNERTRQAARVRWIREIEPKPSAMPGLQCSVCKGEAGECSRNYSGGWLGTKCPNEA